MPLTPFPDPQIDLIRNRTTVPVSGDTVEVSFALAGAVSGGAYMAGVIDYFLERLAAWEKLKLDPAYPIRHRVVLHGATGASAGSLNALLLGAVAPLQYDRYRAKFGGSTVFYKAWVEGIDIRKLLYTKTPKSDTLTCILNCAALDQLGKDLFSQLAAIPLATSLPSYVPDLQTIPFHVAFTLTNLKGSVFSIKNIGTGTFPVTVHDEVFRYDIGFQDGLFRGWPNTTLVNCRSNNTNPGAGLLWKDALTTALASSAFPLALQPQEIQYVGKHGARVMNGDIRWPDGADTATGIGGFVAVDGGCLYNEPIEVARSLLAGVEGMNKRPSNEANRITLYIDPFLEDNQAPADWSALITKNKRIKDGRPKEMTLTKTLVDIATRLFGSVWKEQTRAHLDDIALAADDSAWSRLMIVPPAGALDPDPEEGSDPEASMPRLASGFLGAFSGFLDESFRKYDYALGRKNCQDFLLTEFVMSTKHPASTAICPRSQGHTASTSSMTPTIIDSFPWQALQRNSSLLGPAETRSACWPSIVSCHAPSRDTSRPLKIRFSNPWPMGHRSSSMRRGNSTGRAKSMGSSTRRSARRWMRSDEHRTDSTTSSPFLFRFPRPCGMSHARDRGTQPVLPAP